MAQETYPEMLGLNVEDASDWFPWLVASSLFAKPISAKVARITAALLFANRVTSPDAIEGRGWDELVGLLDRGGYVRYDFSTADRLLVLAAALPGDRLQKIVAAASSAREIRTHLVAIKGIGPKTVEIFLRELRVASGKSVPLSSEARHAAQRLKINMGALHLSARELSRLESVLVRVWVEHCKRRRWQTCPAGGACGCAPKQPGNGKR